MIAKIDEFSQMATLIQGFCSGDLTATLSQIESNVHGTTAENYLNFLLQTGATVEVLETAEAMKRLAGQINVTIHAVGILRCLPNILEAGEKIECLSLGAGSTGCDFDLVTNYRVAEFKFNRWRGCGRDSNREKSILKDFIRLAHCTNEKKRWLYVLGEEHQIKFLKSGRALKSVLSNRDQELLDERYPESVATVGDFYQVHRDKVLVHDISPWLPELVGDEEV